MRGSRVGELAIGRTAMILKGEEIDLDSSPSATTPTRPG